MKILTRKRIIIDKTTTILISNALFPMKGSLELKAPNQAESLVDLEDEGCKNPYSIRQLVAFW